MNKKKNCDSYNTPYIARAHFIINNSRQLKRYNKYFLRYNKPAVEYIRALTAYSYSRRERVELYAD